MGEAIDRAIAGWLRGSGPHAQVRYGPMRDGFWSIELGTVVGSSGLSARGIALSPIGALENCLTIYAGMSVMPLGGVRPIAVNDLRTALDAACDTPIPGETAR